MKPPTGAHYWLNSRGTAGIVCRCSIGKHHEQRPAEPFNDQPRPMEDPD